MEVYCGVAGELAIDGGRIAAMGRTVTGMARKTIDAEGLAVAPGFIDIKTHSDFTLPINPKAERLLRARNLSLPRPATVDFKYQRPTQECAHQDQTSKKAEACKR